jgi:hypothetical protein
MEIEPIRLAEMLVYAVAFGCLCGVLNDLNRITRMLMGIRYGDKKFLRLYDIILPIAKRSVPKYDMSKGAWWEKIIVCVIVTVQDIALFVFGGIGSSMLNYYFNNGRLRIYAPLAVVIGFLLYFFTVGKIVIRFGEVLSFAIKAACLITACAIYRPLRILSIKICEICKKARSNFTKTIAKRQKKVYNNDEDDCVIDKT